MFARTCGTVVREAGADAASLLSVIGLSSTRMRRSSKRFWRSRLFGQAGVSRSYARAAGSLIHSYPAERAVPDQDASFRASRLGVAGPIFGGPVAKFSRTRSATALRSAEPAQSLP